MLLSASAFIVEARSLGEVFSQARAVAPNEIAQARPLASAA